MPLPDRRFLSHPIELHWMGWTTDTAKLAQCGWELSAEQNIMNRTMQIAIRFKHDNYAIHRGFSEVNEFDYHESAHSRNPWTLKARMGMRLAENIMVQYMGDPMVEEWDPIDCNPTYTQRQIQSIDDFAHFKKIPYSEVKEVLLREASMDEVLAMALSKQEPMQEHIRNEMLKRQEMERYNINANPKAVLKLIA